MLKRNEGCLKDASRILPSPLFIASGRELLIFFDLLLYQVAKMFARWMVYFIRLQGCLPDGWLSEGLQMSATKWDTGGWFRWTESLKLPTRVQSNIREYCFRAKESAFCAGTLSFCANGGTRNQVVTNFSRTASIL
ncbi:hypothetical protein AMTR_s00134p00055970 [Amborella trichopoda]|uniref:Uncharacterized protein n=1 Tax=Amborella trichopoda TaxID=13333 RepID=W1P7K9_AMBTC|nr:hypothetical protein AMTR_s00134p00055970 [Amborella trichopoda]